SRLLDAFVSLTIKRPGTYWPVVCASRPPAPDGRARSTSVETANTDSAIGRMRNPLRRIPPDGIRPPEDLLMSGRGGLAGQLPCMRAIRGLRQGCQRKSNPLRRARVPGGKALFAT